MRVVAIHAIAHLLIVTFAGLGLGLALGAVLRALRRRGHRALRYLAWPFIGLFILLLAMIFREATGISSGLMLDACFWAWLVQRGSIRTTFRKTWKAEPVGPEAEV